LSHLQGNLYGGFVGVFLFYLSIQLHQLIYVTSAKEWLHGFGILGIAGWMFASVVVHEGLHGFTWKLCNMRNPTFRVEFSFSWKACAFFTHAVGLMPIRAYIAGSAAPGVLLGLLPVIVGLMSGLIAFTIFGAFNLAVSGGDFVMLWITRQMAANCQVLDHPTRIGFLTIDESSAPSPKSVVSPLQT
jgi:Putative zincin peptidase